MMVWKVIVDLVTGRKNRWDADGDQTVQLLRRERNTAIAEARRLRELGIPLTGNILEDNATGAASRYRLHHRMGQ